MLQILAIGRPLIYMGPVTDIAFIDFFRLPNSNKYFGSMRGFLVECSENFIEFTSCQKLIPNSLLNEDDNDVPAMEEWAVTVVDRKTVRNEGNFSFRDMFGVRNSEIELGISGRIYFNKNVVESTIEVFISSNDGRRYRVRPGGQGLLHLELG